MEMTVEQAAAALRIRQLAAQEENRALEVVLQELFRYRDALKFYATRENYLDGTPMLGSDGMLTQNDEGYTARYALRLDDYYFQPFTRPITEEGNHGNSEPAAS